MVIIPVTCFVLYCFVYMLFPRLFSFVCLFFIYNEGSVFF